MTLASKDASRAEAIRRWPGHAELFARVKDDGRAEAALIAVAGLSRKGGTPWSDDRLGDGMRWLRAQQARERSEAALNGHVPPEVPEPLPIDDGWLDSLGVPFDDRAPERPRFKTLTEFFGEFEPPSYTIENILRSSSLYTVTARTGHGKTAFLIVVMFAIATGRPDILGLETTRGRVVYMTFENPDDVRMRMIVAYLLNIDATEVLDNIVISTCGTSPSPCSSRCN